MSFGNGNLDRALDDILAESKRDRKDNRKGSNINSRMSSGSSHQGHRSNRPAPYSRGDRRHNHRRSDDKWTHDKYDGPVSINDRLGAGPNSSSSRLSGKASRRSKEKVPPRGMIIAGRTRDPEPYSSFRVIWVVNLPHTFAGSDIIRLFSDVGRVDKVRMAIDSNGRFIGKAEIFYRVAADARSAIQAFDGDIVYGTDTTIRDPIHVTYSDLEKAELIDKLKFNSSLPEPRSVPVVKRLGGISSGALLSMSIAAVQQQQQLQLQLQAQDYNQRANGGWGVDARTSSNGRRQHQQKTDHGPKPTAEQLDADLDSYMGTSEAASADKIPENIPAQEGSEMI